MTLTIEKMNERIKARLAREAARAEQDYRNAVAAVERTRLRAEQARVAHEEAAAKTCQDVKQEIAKRELATFQDKLEDTIRRLKLDPKWPAVASRLHLIDLVRAGHTVGQGELNIASDGSLRSTVHRPPIYSSTGSSALTCAEA